MNNMEIALSPQPKKSSHLTPRGLDKIERYGWKIKDRPGRFMLLPKERLLIDPSYQRDPEESEQKVTKIASEWSWVQCGCLYVAHRDGKWFVFDGGHRHAAASRRSDIAQLPCLVFELDGPIDEAKAFIWSNTGQKAPSMASKFKALVFGGDQIALAVCKLIVESRRVPSKQSTASTVACMRSMMAEYENRPDILLKVWPLVVSLSEGRGIHNKILQGLTYIESNVEDGVSLTQSRWRSRLAIVGYDELMRSIHETVGYQGKSGAKVWAEGILRAINKRLQSPLNLRGAA